MEHPVLVSTSQSLKTIQERKFSVPEEAGLEKSHCRWVYVFQKEFATVDPALVDVCFFFLVFFISSGEYKKVLTFEVCRMDNVS